MPKHSRRADVRATAARTFREYGYDSATMDAIADSVGLNKGTLYHYYPSKSAILYELLSDQVDETLALAEKVPSELAPRERLTAFVRLQIERVASISDEIVVFFQELPWIDKTLAEDQVRDLRQRVDTYLTFAEGLLRDGVSATELRAIDPAMIQYSTVGILAYVPNWFRARTRQSKADLVDELTEFVMAGIVDASPAPSANLSRVRSG